MHLPRFPMRVLLVSGMLAAASSGAATAVHADDTSLQKVVVYCSVGSADQAGRSRTLWDVGNADAACSAAATWLGTSNIDFFAVGEFDPNALVTVELRCLNGDGVLKKLFTGIGAEALSAAAFSPEAAAASCVVHQLSDDVQFGRGAYVGKDRPLGHVSLNEQLEIGAILDLLKSGTVKPEAVDLPRLVTDKARRSITWYTPDTQRYLTNDAADAERNKTILHGVDDPTSVNEVDLGSTSNSKADGELTGSAAPALSGAALGSFSLVAPSDGVDLKTSAAPTIDDSHRHTWGDKSKVAIEMVEAVRADRGGNGFFEVRANGYLVNNSLNFVTGRVESKRAFGDAAAGTADSLKVAPRALVLGKTIAMPEPVTIPTNLRKDVPEESFLSGTLYEYDVPFMAGPVPLLLKIAAIGDVGLKADYYYIGAKPNDLAELVYHAGIKPYGRIDGKVSVALATDALPEEFQAAKVETYGKVEIVSETFQASLDGDSSMEGPCADATLLKPQGLAIDVGVEVSVDLSKGQVEAVQKAVESVCGKGVFGLTDMAPESLLSSTVGHIVSTGKTLGGDASGALKDLVNNPSKLGADLQKSCKDADGAIKDGTNFLTFSYKHSFYKRPPISFGANYTLYHNDSCHHTVPPTTLELCNQHPARSLDAAVAHYDTKTASWVLAGWTKLAPASCRMVSNFGRYKGSVYVYARSSDNGMFWGKGDANFCADVNQGFAHQHADSMACAGGGLQQVPTSRVVLKEGANRFNFTVSLPEVTLCNRSEFDHLYAATGYSRGSIKASSGWTDLPNGSCVSALALSDGQVYSYATNDTANADTEWTGNGAGVFCVKDGLFKNLRVDSGQCASGGRARPFNLLDTSKMSFK